MFYKKGVLLPTNNIDSDRIWHIVLKKEQYLKTPQMYSLFNWLTLFYALFIYYHPKKRQTLNDTMFREMDEKQSP